MWVDDLTTNARYAMKDGRHMTQLKMTICSHAEEGSRRMTTLMETTVSIQHTRRRHVLTDLVQYVLSYRSGCIKAASLQNRFHELCSGHSSIEHALIRNHSS